MYDSLHFFPFMSPSDRLVKENKFRSPRLGPSAPVRIPTANVKHYFGLFKYFKQKFEKNYRTKLIAHPQGRRESPSTWRPSGRRFTSPVGLVQLVQLDQLVLQIDKRHYVRAADLYGYEEGDGQQEGLKQQGAEVTAFLTGAVTRVGVTCTR